MIKIIRQIYQSCLRKFDLSITLLNEKTFSDLGIKIYIVKNKK